MAASRKRRWFQFSLRTLLIVFTAGSVWLGWTMYRWRHQQAEQRKAAAAVKELGGEASFSYSDASFLSLFFERHNAENDFMLMEKNIQDDDLKIFASAEMTRGIYLFRNEVTDDGLMHLKNLRHLRLLDLRQNKGITDRGLAHLENLHEMETLILIGTKVTPAGVAELQRKLPKAKIAF